MSFFISVLFSIDTGDQETDEWRVIDSTQSASDFSTDDESSSSSYTNDETSSFSSEDSTDSECRRAIPHKRARLSSEEIADKGEDCQRAWAEWFKEEEEEPSTSKRPRTRGLHSRCPVPGCNARSKHLKHHVWDCHIPQVFWDHPWRELEWSPDYHRLRASCLQILARWLLGPAGTLEALVEHVDSNISLPKDCPIIDRSKRQILDLAYTMKWPRIRDVTLHPLSGPAPLIHWRILVALVAGMSSKMRTDFLSLGKEELYRLQDRLRPARRRFHKVAWSPRQRPSTSFRREQEPEVWRVIDECGGDDDTQGQ